MQRRLEREEGFSLLELLVAMTLIGIIMTGLAVGIMTALEATRDSRERTVAANLASQEVDLAHAVPIDNLQEGNLQRVERVGNTDFTILRQSRWENGVVEAQACTALANSATGRGRRFLQVTVSVTWAGIGSRGPVTASTAITPSVASYRQGFGHVAVTVTDRNAAPVQGITVTLTGNGITRVVTTTSIGCAFFTDVPVGTGYTVSYNQPGYVDLEDRTQLGTTAGVDVPDRETTKVPFTYDRRAALDVTVTSPQGGSVPDGVFAIAENNAATRFRRFSGYGSGGSAQRLIGVNPDEGLFPYTGGWTAWIGCEHNDPLTYAGTRTGLNPGPNQTATGNVQGGTARVALARPDSSRAGQTLYALDQLAPSGPCASRVALGTFNGAGVFTSRDVILPYGDWRLYVGVNASALNTDPFLSGSSGQFEVRPNQLAIYTEPPPYFEGTVADGPFLYYRLDESPYFTARDSSGSNRHGGYQSGVTRGTAGALSGEPASRAVSLNGTTNAYVTTPTQLTNPNTLSLEIWFQTASGYAQGGRLVGFGSNQTGTSGTIDRHLYMNNSGQLLFGVRPSGGTRRTIISPLSYNDGAWHHAVVTLGPGGMALYVDGTRVANTASYTTGQNYSGYFRVGYDSLSSWTGPVANAAFNGNVDEFAYYQSALTAGRVTAHYAARTGTGYAAAVTADSPYYYYRFDETVARDSSGNARHGTYQGGALGGLTGALNDANTSVAFDGTASAYVSNPVSVANPQVFSIEAWFTTLNGYVSGGRIVGFGSATTGTSASYDRHLYMTNGGRIVFGVHPSARQTIQSPLAYNDGQWHHVVATLSGAGMVLYVDGQAVASNPGVTAARNYTGYWRVGTDTLASWASVPSSAGLVGAIDEVAVYHTALTARQVRLHYHSSGR